MKSPVVAFQDLKMASHAADPAFKLSVILIINQYYDVKLHCFGVIVNWLEDSLEKIAFWASLSLAYTHLMDMGSCPHGW